MKGKVFIAALLLLTIGLGIGGWAFYDKYTIEDEMILKVEEVTTSEYPEDPSHRSLLYGRYQGRQMRLVKKDATHFDFILESDNPSVATITFKDIDLRLLIPVRPQWVIGDEDLEVVALVDREWNRQQVRFPITSDHIEVSGGDGFEEKGLYTAELARNCLNAGLWEVILTTREDGKKAMYYQGWFDFPLGHYKRIFEDLNQISYWKHWHRLEHWVDPHGRRMNLNKLREIEEERLVAAVHDPDELLIFAGEQKRKSRTVNAKNVLCWKGFCQNRHQVRFATFLPPGRYHVDVPWENEFDRLAAFEKGIIRVVKTPATDRKLHEIELVFRSEEGEVNRFIVGGIDLNELPKLPMEKYNKGLYMPMGIGIPPFYQPYAVLKKNPPYEKPYYSFLLDENDHWINHHEVGVDGPVIHRDMRDPNKLHVYLLSYERHSLVGHYIVPIE